MEKVEPDSNGTCLLELENVICPDELAAWSYNCPENAGVEVARPRSLI